MPGADVTPSQPINIAATINVDGNIIVTCDATADTTRYRARMMRIGIDSGYDLAASGPVPMLVIPGVLPGQTVQIVMQSVNGTAQGVPSKPVVVTIPLPAVKATKAPEAPALTTKAVEAPVLAELVVPATNGSRNGHDEVVSVRS
jgi:hypothetical protein